MRYWLWRWPFSCFNVFFQNNFVYVCFEQFKTIADSHLVRLAGYPLTFLSHFKSGRACGDLPLLHLSSRRPSGGEGWCGEAISHIQFTYGCHGLLQAEQWCHPCVGPFAATGSMGRLLSVKGRENLSLFKWYDECGAALLCACMSCEICSSASTEYLSMCVAWYWIYVEWQQVSNILLIWCEIRISFCWETIYITGVLLTSKHKKWEISALFTWIIGFTLVTFYAASCHQKVKLQI